MKINHWVETTDQEVNDLYMMVVKVATAAYPSEEEENATILATMPLFKSALDDLVSQAFRLGYEKKKKMRKLKEMSVDETPSSVMP